jgi:dihydroxy-acid dehydratase
MSGIFGQLTSYSDEGFSRFLRGVFLASGGYDSDDLDRPVIGIAQGSSDFATCHRELPALVRAVARGVAEAGGLPMVFSTMTLPEVMMSPTSMLYRNLLAMETEELLRSHPIDGAVLIGGCDKTVPAQLMAAISADVPAVQLVVGPMLTSSWEGERLGACTDCRRYWARYREGAVSAEAIAEVQQRLATTGGTCMVMGTASTMAAIAETMGFAVSHSATAPSPTGDRLRAAVRSGRAAVRAAQAGWRPSRYLTRQSFENAATVLAALGGSTNAVVHLLALAGRAQVPFSLEDIGEIAARVPVIVACKPVGEFYLEDLHVAGGIPAVLDRLGDLIHREALTVDQVSLGEQLAGRARPAEAKVLRSVADPVSPAGGLAVLKGSLAPGGAVIKAAAASPGLLRHRGPALVFESPQDAQQRLDDPMLPVTERTVLVLRNAGPVAAGMPEAGGLPIPARLARAGVRDLVRISDARMSGTAFGTVVLHVAPEAAVGGPLALVRDGDEIELDVAERRLDLLVDPAELARRAAGWQPPPLPARGWRHLYARSVLQADKGVDLDFLIGR